MDPAQFKAFRDRVQNVGDEMKNLNKSIQEIKKKDHQITEIEKNNKNDSNSGLKRKIDIPPPRNSSDSPSSITSNKNDKLEDCSPNETKKRISAYDYAAWDKFNVDEALESVDIKDASPKVSNNSQLPTMHKKVTNAPVSDYRAEVVKLKDEGNKLYAEGKYLAAVEKYSTGIKLEPLYHVLFANRAMASIKLEKYAEAESDCDICLDLEPTYVKGYLRRATARAATKNFKGALVDYNKVLTLEPTNKFAKDELQGIKSKLNEKKRKNKSKEQLKEENKREVITTADKPLQSQSKKSLKKLEIIEVESVADIPSHQNKESKATEDISNISISEKNTTLISKITPATKPKIVELSTDSKEKTSALRCSSSTPPIEKLSLTAIPPKPRTSHQFMSFWSRVSSAGDHLKAYQWLTSIKVTDIEKFEVEVECLVSFIHTFSVWLSADVEPSLPSQDEVFSSVCLHLSALCRSPGFDLNVLFLTEEDKEGLKQLINNIASRSPNNSHEDITKIKDML